MSGVTMQEIQGLSVSSGVTVNTGITVTDIIMTAYITEDDGNVYGIEDGTTYYVSEN